MATTVTHATAATGVDAGDGSISKDAWNEEHVVVGGGGLVLLEQHTASASATLDFTTFISSTYDDYVFELLAIRPATDGATLTARFGTGGGPTYDEGSNYYHARFNETSQPANGGTGAGPVTAITLSSAVSNAAGGYGNLNATVHLKNPQSTSVMRYLYGTYAHHDGNYVNIGFSGGLWAEAATAATAVRFLFSSGNIASGTIRVYGIVKV